MTVISLAWSLHLAFTTGNQCQQVTSAVRRRLLVHQAASVSAHVCNQVEQTELYSHYVLWHKNDATMCIMS